MAAWIGLDLHPSALVTSRIDNIQRANTKTTTTKSTNLFLMLVSNDFSAVHPTGDWKWRVSTFVMNSESRCATYWSIVEPFLPFWLCYDFNFWIPPRETWLQQTLPKESSLQHSTAAHLFKRGGYQAPKKKRRWAELIGTHPHRMMNVIKILACFFLYRTWRNWWFLTNRT